MDWEKLRDEIIANFHDYIGDAVDELTKADTLLLEQLATDAAKLTLMQLTGQPDIDREVAVVNASLANLSVAKYFKVQTIFWLAVKRAGEILISSLVKVALAAII